MISERDIEQKLRKYAQSKNILFLKFTSPGHDGVPDRLCIGPTGSIVFIEVKAPGKKVSPLQAAMHNLLRAHNAKVFVVDDFEQGKVILDGL